MRSVCLLQEYNKKNPKDRDLMFYRCIIALQMGDIETAMHLSNRAIKVFPTSYEAYYYAGCAYEAIGKVIEALRAYNISKFLYEFFMKDDKDVYADVCEQIVRLQKDFEELVEENTNRKDLEKLLKAQSFIERSGSVWGKFEKTSRDSSRLIVGTEYWITDDEKRFVGIYRRPEATTYDKQDMSLVKTQAEFLKYVKKGTDMFVSGTGEYLLPIASTQSGNTHIFTNEQREYTIQQRNERHFNYYKVKGGSLINSKYPSYYGHPIPLAHDTRRKKIVLSLFVDGLSQEVIQGTDFEKLMPNTYEFFSKGTICTNTYSCAEWTYPSIASYESGLDTLGHMMFHNMIDIELPREVPTLTEYMKSKGYFTSKIDGDWRCMYSYGYARGCDQYVYQVQSAGSRAEQEIINVIEHIESFKDTDQYLWMCIGDLHDVADGFDLSLAVQRNLTLEERISEDIGVTSVKQKSSWRKGCQYKKVIQYIDVLLGLLYYYLEKNFSDDEMVISLFADHGQGYLVPEENDFLSKERTKVAFMFRGSNIEQKMTDEIISTADYLPIMCKLCDIPVTYDLINGKLPLSFGGEKEREYTITESIHPGDNYVAVANSKEFEIFFENMSPTDDEGRFRLSSYKVYGYYNDGSVIMEQELLNKYENIFLDRIATHIIYE